MTKRRRRPRDVRFEEKADDDSARQDKIDIFKRPEEVPVITPQAQSAVGTLTVCCPNNHILRVSEETPEGELICPECETKFELKYKKTLEYQHARERLQDERDIQRGRKFENWAIALGIVLGLIVVSFAIWLIS